MSRRDPNIAIHELCDAVADRYRAAGRVHQGFVRGKLRHDPMYRALLFGGWLPSAGRLVDVGCGRGILLALIDSARRLGSNVSAPAGWTPPSPDLALHGIEFMPGAAAVARTALGPEATIEVGDAAVHALPRAEVILLLDVLHYLRSEDQVRLVARASRALEPGGMLVVREADAGPGWRFATTRVAERLRALFRGHVRQHFCYRSTEAWQALFEAQGLTVRAQPMSHGTPFDNQLIFAYRVIGADETGGDEELEAKTTIHDPSRAC